MNNKEVIKQFGDQLVVDIKKAIPKSSGRTARSVYVEYTDSGFIIRGGSQINSLINGRKPTSFGAKGGSPTLQEEILGWIKALSITPREESMTQVSLSWAISKSIHRDGYKGDKDLLSGVINQRRFDVLAKSLLNEASLSIQSSVIKKFK